KLQEAEANSAEALTEKYKVLNEEMERNANARKTILAGGESVMAIGQTVQGADVPQLMKDFYKLGSRTDKQSDAYEEARKELMRTLVGLVRVDKKFIQIYRDFDDLGLITGDTSKDMNVFSNAIINAGQNLANLPQLMKDTDTALNDLGKDAAKNTNLSRAVDKAQKEITSLGTGIKDSQIQMDKDMLEQTQSATLSMQMWKDKVSLEFLERSNIYGGSAQTVGDALGKKTPAQQKRINELKQSIKDAEARGATGDFASHEARTQVLNDQRKQIKLLQERKREIEEEHTILAKEEKRRIKRVQKQLAAQAKFARNRALGITIAGKIHNLEEKRFSERSKLEKAEDAVIDAKYRRERARGKDNDQSAIESLE
ncbi:uncharacterized protein METZ01_LOCUS310923, partial [marine metagenome]